MATEARQPQASQSHSLAVNILGGFFILLGIAAIVLLLISIFTNPRITGADGFGATILALLGTVGIIIPLLLIAFSVFSVRLGLGLLRRQTTSAAWAEQTFLWLIILTIAYILVNLPNAFTDSATADQWLPIVVGLIAIGLFAFGWYWLRNNKVLVFEGVDTLGSRESRLAWNLLIPTIAVLILIAARPLERTFIGSLTNQEFAGTRETEFVGIQNYLELLGFTFNTLPCETDEATGQCMTEVNSEGQEVTVYPRPLTYLRDTYPWYREGRYRVVAQFNLFGNEIVLSARDPQFFTSIGNTLFFTVVSVTIEFILGLIVALVVNSKFPGRGLMRTAMLVPWAIPTVVSARLWEVMLRDNQSGVINHFLVNSGLVESPQAWLANPELQIWTMIFVDVWKTVPFIALILLAGLQVIPSDIYEAADVDGAGKIRQFFQLTLPLLRPTIAVALVFRTLDAIRVFDVFNVLAGRQLESMATYNQRVLVENQEFGYASAIGVTIFAIILIFTVMYVRILGVGEE